MDSGRECTSASSPSLRRRRTYAATFESLSSSADPQSSRRKTIAGAASDEVARIRKVAIENAATGKFGIEAGHWFTTMTDKINLMKEVENRLSEGLVAQAGALRKQAAAALALFLGIGVVAMGGALIVGIALMGGSARSIVDHAQDHARPGRGRWGPHRADPRRRGTRRTKPACAWRSTSSWTSWTESRRPRCGGQRNTPPPHPRSCPRQASGSPRARSSRRRQPRADGGLPGADHPGGEQSADSAGRRTSSPWGSRRPPRTAAPSSPRRSRR